MNKIRILPPEVINQIAAGEVVERPASVVKELIENSLDAKATEIVVEITEGGMTSIKVTDNGLGMSEADAMMAIQAHATSKLVSFDDLHSLSTMGFRGEALASISSVSRFTLETKPVEGISGIKISLDNGIVSSETVPATQGSSITVRDLFYNVPARRKFLKKAETEYLHILDLFVGFALLHVNVSWKLIHNGNLIYQVRRTENWAERISELLGSDVGGEIIPISAQGSVSISGFIGKPSIAKTNKKSQFLYVNGRLVSDYSIAKAVAGGYGDLLAQNSHPVFILNVKVDPGLVDVNVHPRKTEVRFANQSEIYRQVQAAVRGTLNAAGILNSAPIEFNYAPGTAYAPVDQSGFIFKPSNAQSRSGSYAPKKDFHGAINALNFSQSITRNEATKAGQEVIDDWRLLGQIHKSYLLVENFEGFLVIDQHAAAERLNYERLKSELASQSVKFQKLLVPQKLELNIRQSELIKQNLDLISGLGFELEFFGQNTLMINSIPHIASHADPVLLVKGIIGDMEEDDFSHLHSYEEKQERALKYAACRGAIMFQDKLSQEEQISLLAQIKLLPIEKQTCCHGRPFMKQFLKEDLEKLFHRR